MGFLGPATPTPTTPSRRIAFQSRCGFSGSCNKITSGVLNVSSSVSIPMWVFWVLQRRRTVADVGANLQFQSRCGFSGSCNPVVALVQAKRPVRVSIPMWVFWVLQPRGSASTPRVSRFNPDVGFLGPATGGENPPTGSIKLSPALARPPRFVDRGRTRHLKRSTKADPFSAQGTPPPYRTLRSQHKIEI